MLQKIFRASLKLINVSAEPSIVVYYSFETGKIVNFGHLTWERAMAIVIFIYNVYI